MTSSKTFKVSEYILLDAIEDYSNMSWVVLPFFSHIIQSDASLEYFPHKLMPILQMAEDFQEQIYPLSLFFLSVLLLLSQDSVYYYVQQNCRHKKDFDYL